MTCNFQNPSSYKSYILEELDSCTLVKDLTAKDYILLEEFVRKWDDEKELYDGDDLKNWVEMLHIYREESGDERVDRVIESAKEVISLNSQPAWEKQADDIAEIM